MKPNLDIKLSRAQVMAIAGGFRHDECSIKAIFDQMKQTSHPRAAYNAAWVLTYLAKEDKKIYLQPRREELISMATSTTLCFRRGLILTILINLPMSEPDGKLWDFCLANINNAKESVGTRCALIKLAARMCKPYPELRKELMQCLDMMPQDASPSIAAAKRNALKMIQK